MSEPNVCGAVLDGCRTPDPEPQPSTQFHKHSRNCYEDPGGGHGSPFLICGKEATPIPTRSELVVKLQAALEIEQTPLVTSQTWLVIAEALHSAMALVIQQQESEAMSDQAYRECYWELTRFRCGCGQTKRVGRLFCTMCFSSLPIDLRRHLKSMLRPEFVRTWQMSQSRLVGRWPQPSEGEKEPAAVQG